MILSANAYDPEEDEGRRRPSHFTKKDFKVMSIVGVVVIIILIPLYIYLKQQRDSRLCIQNMEAIGKSMNLYASDYNDRFPPVSFIDAMGEHATVYNGNQTFTWVSLLARYMTARSSFLCPSAIDEENSINVNPLSGKGQPKFLPSSYGMYGALSSVPTGSIASLGTTALVADSSSNGANGTIDPLPFTGSGGQAIRDGFLIGLDDSNFTESQSSRQIFGKAKEITRLAYIDSAKTGFTADTVTRHPGGIHVLMADLHLETRQALALALTKFGKTDDIRPPWAIPN
jgi:prepilin-type processing-associated H-X9-DG protein